MVSKFSFRGAQLFITDFTKVHYIPIPRIISIYSTHLRPIFEIHINIRFSSGLPLVVLIIDVSSSHIRNRIFYQAVCMLRSFLLIEFHENKVYLLSIRGALGICFRLLQRYLNGACLLLHLNVCVFRCVGVQIHASICINVHTDSDKYLLASRVCLNN